MTNEEANRNTLKAQLEIADRHSREVMQDPKYVAHLKNEADIAKANISAQEKAYKDKCRYQCRMQSLEIANKVSHPSFDGLIESAEKLYQWLIKDL